METNPPTKIELRRQMQERMGRLSSPEAYAARFCQRVLSLPEVLSAAWVAGFVSFGTEVPTHELLQKLLADGKRVCVPSFDPLGQRYLCSELKHFDTDLARGRWGILEPKPTAIRPVPTDRPDVWLVPGLAFDTQGNRLGRGMGYFDQLLSGARGVKIGLAYEFQILREVPVETHDIRMDFIVTETRIVNYQR